MGVVSDWDKANNKSTGGSNNIGFLKLEVGEYKVRLVLRPIKYMQHWEPVICQSPGVNPETKQVIDPLMLKGHTPTPRWACLVLDRKDGNRLKLMDFPPSLFDLFADWKAASGDEPGGPKGTDWHVKRTSEGAKKRTKYTAMPLDRTPFTPEEIQMFKGMGGSEGLTKKLHDLRRDNTPQEINDLLAKAMDKISGNAPSAGSNAPAAKTTQPASQGAAPAASDGDGADLAF